ncbi:MAG: conjugative transposon protein TraN [Bacteroidota bacterium]
MYYHLNKLIILFLIGVSLALYTLEAVGQSLNDPLELEITYNKTTSVVFPALIKSVDRGSRDILAQKAKGVENILQLKAARHSFPLTNLTVITSDGVIHEFAVHYSKEPRQQVLILENAPLSTGRGAGGEAKLIFQTDMMETEMENHASKIVNTKRSIRFVSESKYKVGLSLRGIYIKDNVIFYHFRMDNQSNINYDVDFLRFYIQDRQKVKRTASQEVDVKPMYVFGNAEKIRGRTSEDVVYALEKFTIPDAKRLHIEMFEKNGGRNLELSIRNRTIVKAKLIK